MKRLLTTLCCLFSLSLLWGQNPAAYVIYDQDGNSSDYQTLLEEMSQRDLVFLGEIHNCTIAHWMEKLIVADLYKIHGEELMLGAEMFERDDQVILNEYLQGLIPESRFKAEAKLWENYATDYRPLVEFAKEHHLPFIATNVARRYANLVSKEGLEALEKTSEEARQFIAPLPIHYIPNPLVDAYFQNMMNPCGTQTVANADKTASKGRAQVAKTGNGKTATMPKMPSMAMMKANIDKLSLAQGVKDATMAWSISESLKGKMIHVNGSFHSTGHAGIINYLNVYRPGLKIGTVEVVLQKEVDVLEEQHKGKADFIICVPDNMATTY